eukprot:349382_1
MAQLLQTEGQISQTEGLDLRTLLNSNDLNQLVAKLVDDAKLTIDHLLSCKQDDIRTICNDLGVNSIDTIKLITAVRMLPNSFMNTETEPSNTIIVIGVEEKAILDQLENKKEHLSNIIKQTQQAMSQFKTNMNECNEQINAECDKMISMIEKYRTLLLNQTMNIESEKQEKLKQLVIQSNNTTQSIEECKQAAVRSDISSQIRLQQMRNIYQQLPSDEEIKIDLSERFIFNYDHALLNIEPNLQSMNIVSYFKSKSNKNRALQTPNFSGMWQLVKNTHFSKYLKDEGYNTLHIQLASKVNSTLEIIHSHNTIKMNSTQTMGVSLQEDDDHGNRNCCWIVDGKTYTVKGDTGHIIKKTAIWSNDETKVIGESYDTNTNSGKSYDETKVIGESYEIYVNESGKLCLKRTNKRNISMTQIWSKVK